MPGIVRLQTVLNSSHHLFCHDTIRTWKDYGKLISPGARKNVFRPEGFG
jgi:hypothetical protein